MTPLCRLPWQGLDISPQGEYRPCCKYTSIISNSMDGYTSSIELASLKKEFEIGVRPSGCSRCWQDEDAGIESKRQFEMREHLSDVPFDDTYRVVSFSFGNICNLACRTCSSYSSSKWTVTAHKLSPIIPISTIFSHTEFYKDPALVANFKEISKDALLIEFPGGEPFITGVDEHKNYLRFLIKNDASTKKLHYMTNCTIYPDAEFWDLWKHFKNVDIQLSLDGTGKLAEYIRWPSNWDVVHQNVKRFQQAGGNIQLSISHTVSILNVFAINDFVDWCKFEGLPAPYIGLVSAPLYYNVKHLPAPAKAYISQQLTSDIVQPLKNYITGEISNENADDIIAQFVQWTTELDKIRSQHITSVCPKLCEFIGIT